MNFSEKETRKTHKITHELKVVNIHFELSLKQFPSNSQSQSARTTIKYNSMPTKDKNNTLITFFLLTISKQIRDNCSFGFGFFLRANNFHLSSERFKSNIYLDYHTYYLVIKSFLLFLLLLPSTYTPIHIVCVLWKSKQFRQTQKLHREKQLLQIK